MALETKDFDDIRALLTSMKAYITSKERVRLLDYLKSVLLLAEPDGLLDVVKQSQRDLLGNTAKLPYIKREWRETLLHVLLQLPVAIVPPRERRIPVFTGDRELSECVAQSSIPIFAYKSGSPLVKFVKNPSFQD